MILLYICDLYFIFDVYLFVRVKRSKLSKMTTSAAENTYDVMENKDPAFEMGSFSKATLV